MTFEEANKLLQSLRAKKRRVRALKNRITELRDDAGILRSSLGGDGMPHGSSISDTTANVAIRIAEKCEHFEALLEECFAIEDKLADAIDTLSDEEQYIIIECYMTGKPIWRIAKEMGYDERSIYRKKNKAIARISAIYKSCQ